MGRCCCASARRLVPSIPCFAKLCWFWAWTRWECAASCRKRFPMSAASLSFHSVFLFEATPNIPEQGWTILRLIHISGHSLNPVERAKTNTVCILLSIQRPFSQIEHSITVKYADAKYMLHRCSIQRKWSFLWHYIRPDTPLTWAFAKQEVQFWKAIKVLSNFILKLATKFSQVKDLLWRPPVSLSHSWFLHNAFLSLVSSLAKYLSHILAHASRSSRGWMI